MTDRSNYSTTLNLLTRAAKSRIKLTGQWGEYEVRRDGETSDENFVLKVEKAEIGHTIVRALRERYISKGMVKAGYEVGHAWQTEMSRILTPEKKRRKA